MTLIDTNLISLPEQLQIRLEALLEQEDEIRQLRKDEAYAYCSSPPCRTPMNCAASLKPPRVLQQDLLPAFPVKFETCGMDSGVPAAIWPETFSEWNRPTMAGWLLLCDVMGHGIRPPAGAAADSIVRPCSRIFGSGRGDDFEQ